MHHNVYGEWSFIPSCFLVRERSVHRVDHNDKKALLDRAAAPIPTGCKRQCGRSCCSLCVAVAVDTADSMMKRRPNRAVERSIFQLRRGLEALTFPREKAARRENLEADAMWCMCQSCSAILLLRRNRRCARARATGSLLPTQLKPFGETNATPDSTTMSGFWSSCKPVLSWCRQRRIQGTQVACVHGWAKLQWFCVLVETQTRGHWVS